MTIEDSFKGDESPFDELQRLGRTFARLLETSFPDDDFITAIVDLDGRRYVITARSLEELSAE